MPDRPDITDKAQIGLTPTASRHLQQVMASGWFSKEQDAYRVAIAIALANDVVANPEDLAGIENKYNFMGGVDRDGRLRALINALSPDHTSAPARFAERLAHAGLAILASRLGDEDALLSAVLAGTQATNADPLPRH
jgi:hypothetical protein